MSVLRKTINLSFSGKITAAQYKEITGDDYTA